MAQTTGHVGLNVTDLDRAIGFYRDAFGLDVMLESKEPAFAFLGRGRDIVLTLWQQADGRFPVDRPGLHHLSFQVGSFQELEEAERRLRAMGVALHHDGIVPHAEGEDSGGIFFEDPDGIRLEIFAGSGASEAGPAPFGAAPTCGFF